MLKSGAVVVAPDIEYSSPMDHKEKAPLLNDYSGLNLTDFYVVPHDQNWEFKKTVEQIVRDYSMSLDLKVINDKQAILVKDGKAEILDK